MQNLSKASADQCEKSLARGDAAETLTLSAQTSSSKLKRSLKSRQINMMSIAGAIGTGLLISTGPALASGGPGSLLISFIVVGFICYNVLAAYGEMSTMLPMDRAFSGYAARFVDPAYGCATGFNYFCKYSVLLANNLTASGLIMQYWLPQINVGVWITSFAVPIICINLLPVKVFGEVEFVASIIKTIVVVGLMIVCLVIDLGGGPEGHRIGFHYWNDPGAFKEHILAGSTGKFLGWWTCMVDAGFVYMGTELVGVTFGEAEKPWKVIPKAIRQTAWRISFLYIGGVLLLGMVVPYNSPDLLTATKAKTGAGASPFIVAVTEAGIRTLPGLVNGSLLVFVLSAANSDIYISSRTLYGLARDGHLPQIFTKTYGSVPLIAVATSSLFVLLAFINTTESSNKVFGDLVSLATIFGLFNWISILISYLSLRRGMEAQNIPRASMPFKERWMKLRASVSLFFTCLIIFFNGIANFIPNFKAESFVFAYTGIPVHLALIVGAKIILRTQRVELNSMDLDSGRITAEDKERAEAAERLEATPSSLKYSFRRMRGILPKAKDTGGEMPSGTT